MRLVPPGNIYPPRPPIFPPPAALRRGRTAAASVDTIFDCVAAGVPAAAGCMPAGRTPVQFVACQSAGIVSISRPPPPHRPKPPSPRRSVRCKSSLSCHFEWTFCMLRSAQIRLSVIYQSIPTLRLRNSIYMQIVEFLSDIRRLLIIG